LKGWLMGWEGSRGSVLAMIVMSIEKLVGSWEGQKGEWEHIAMELAAADDKFMDEWGVENRIHGESLSVMSESEDDEADESMEYIPPSGVKVVGGVEDEGYEADREVSLLEMKGLGEGIKYHRLAGTIPVTDLSKNKPEGRYQTTASLTTFC